MKPTKTFTDKLQLAKYIRKQNPIYTLRAVRIIIDRNGVSYFNNDTTKYVYQGYKIWQVYKVK